MKYSYVKKKLEISTCRRTQGSGSVKVEFQLVTASTDGSDIAWLSSAAAHSSAMVWHITVMFRVSMVYEEFPGPVIWANYL